MRARDKVVLCVKTLLSGATISCPCAPYLVSLGYQCNGYQCITRSLSPISLYLLYTLPFSFSILCLSVSMTNDSLTLLSYQVPFLLPLCQDTHHESCDIVTALTRIITNLRITTQLLDTPNSSHCASLNAGYCQGKYL